MRIGFARKALVAQMPELLLPHLARLLDLTLQCHPGPLLALGGAHHDPTLLVGRLWGWCPEEGALLLPAAVSYLQGGARPRGRVGHAADPAHAGSRLNVLTEALSRVTKRRRALIGRSDLTRSEAGELAELEHTLSDCSQRLAHLC